MRSGFRQIRRRQVDRELFGGQRQRQNIEGGADALARFAHSFVGQSDNGKARQSRAYRAFNIYQTRHHAFKGHSIGASDHKT